MEAADPVSPSGGHRLSWRDPALRWVLLGALLLQLGSWWLQRGYPLADAVEFMDRAQAWAGGEALTDARSVRSFAFSSLFVPPFLVARWLGLEDLRPVLAVARLIELALSMGLVIACARLAQRVAGRSAGLAVGAAIAINPLVLQFGSQPISGIASALCIAMAMDSLIVRGTGRDGWRGGIWLGLAFLTAYQSLLISLAVFAVLLARDRWKHRTTWLCLGAGLVLCLLVQLALDRVVYGQWQGSLWRYALENGGYLIVHLLLDLGLPRAAGDLYQQISDLRGHEYVRDDSVTQATMRFGAWWYVLNAPRLFVWPLLLLLLAGFARAILKPRWTSSLAALSLAMTLFIMARKGDKSLRLCLPLIPLCVPLFAMGWDWFATRGRVRWLAHATLIAALPLSWAAYTATRPRANAAYWDAAQWIDERAELESRPEPVRCASAYDWAVYLRFGPRVEKVKLADTLDRWKLAGDEQRARIEAELDTLDWLILHQPLLASQPGLIEPLARRFRVAAAFYDQDQSAELGAVLVLQRADRGGARLVSFASDAPSPQVAREMEFRAAADSEPLKFLGFDLAQLPGSQWWWITYHWKLPAEHGPLEVRDRITSPDDRNTWQNDHLLGRGLGAPNAEARYLSEGFLFVPSAVDLALDPRFRPMGGAYRRGELLPLRAWIEVRDKSTGSTLEVYRANESTPVKNEFGDSTWKWSVDGCRFSKDGLAQVGGFLLPVHPRAFARDDGKPVPD